MCFILVESTFPTQGQPNPNALSVKNRANYAEVRIYTKSKRLQNKAVLIRYVLGKV